MAKKKKAKEKAKPKAEVNLLKPLNIYELGGDQDPCFGKHYDLTTEECKRCGDSELCAIASAQKLNLLRNNIEAKQEFKDINNTVKDPSLKTFIMSKKAKGYKLSKITRLAMKKLGSDKDEIRKVYKSIK